MVSERAQNRILAALVNAAFVEEDQNEIELADEIRYEATKMAKRWGVSEVSGLPGTWKRGKRIPDYS